MPCPECGSDPCVPPCAADKPAVIGAAEWQRMQERVRLLEQRVERLAHGDTVGRLL